MRSASDAQALGSFVGQRFTAEVHLTDGSSGNVEFLVAEKALREAHGGVVAEA